MPLKLLIFLPGAAAGWGLALFLRRLPAEDCGWEGGGPGAIAPLTAALLSGILWVFCALCFGFTVEGGLHCLLVTALVGLSLYDLATGVIPPQLSLFILALGALRTATQSGELYSHLAGLFAVAAPLWLLFALSKGRAIGGGDIKLMAGCGLFLGWQLALLGFFAGCIIGSVIHIARMKLSGASRMLAMGPYLSAGVTLAALWGQPLLRWYLGLFV